MMKKVLIGFAVITLTLSASGFIAYKKTVFTPEKLAEFIKEHPDKSSLHLVVDDSVWVDFNAGKMMPLASTVKIIIAIEFSKQAAAGRLDPEEQIKLSEIRRFYIPGTDGGAHPAWIKRITDQQLVQNGTVSHHEVAKGMIWYSSNANAEYLMMKLGIENINNRLDSLALKDHDPVYPFASSLYLFRKNENETSEQAIERVKDLSLVEYRNQSLEIFHTLQRDTSMKSTLNTRNLTMDAQKIWSDNLPASTTSAYTSVMKKMNNKEYFSDQVHSTLDPVMEVIMTNPANREWLKHSGMKGGSTAFVLTKALYATTQSGEKIEMAYFLNDLTPMESYSIQQSMNAFELEVLRNKEFRNKLARLLNE